MAILDAVILDRVFQPIADWLHQQTGIRPAQIAEFFAVGNVVTEIIVQFLRNLTIEEPLQIVVMVMGVFVSLVLSAIMIYPRFVERGHVMNPRRVMLVGIRVVFLFFTFVNIGTVPMLLMNQPFYFKGITSIVGFVSQICVTLGLYFASLQSPPPREQRKSVWGYAT